MKSNLCGRSALALIGLFFALGSAQAAPMGRASTFVDRVSAYLMTPAAPIVTDPATILYNAPTKDATARTYGFGEGAPNIGEVFGPINGTTYSTSTGGQGQMAQVQYASINATTAGSPNTVITGVTGKDILVLSYWMTPSAAGTVQWEDNSGTPVTFMGAATVTASEIINPATTPWGQFSTTVTGKSLMLAVTGTSNQVSGTVAYITY